MRICKILARYRAQDLPAVVRRRAPDGAGEINSTAAPPPPPPPLERNAWLGWVVCSRRAWPAERRGAPRSDGLARAAHQRRGSCQDQAADQVRPAHPRLPGQLGFLGGAALLSVGRGSCQLGGAKTGFLGRAAEEAPPTWSLRCVLCVCGLAVAAASKAATSSCSQGRTSTGWTSGSTRRSWATSAGSVSQPACQTDRQPARRVLWPRTPGLTHTAAGVPALEPAAAAAAARARAAHPGRASVQAAPRRPAPTAF
jgi:hypothetical protein